MKKNTKTLLLVILVLFVLQAIFSYGFFLYRSSYTLSIYPINDSKPVTDNSIRDRKTLDLDSSKFPTVIFHGLNDNIHPGTGSINDINVYVTKSNSVGWARFIPVFKYFRFSSKISYRCTFPMNKSTQTSISESGAFEIKGRSNIFGICSDKRAKQIVMNIITEQAQRKIKEDIQKMVGFKRIN